jgi:hypothetical protein
VQGEPIGSPQQVRSNRFTPTGLLKQFHCLFIIALQRNHFSLPVPGQRHTASLNLIPECSAAKENLFML